MTVSVTSTEAHEASPAHSGFWALTLGGIGVVFGDIGTSPLYAFREAVSHAAHGEAVSRAIVLGVLSLILWALFIVVTAKYVLLLLRADNNGEGGTLSLMALGQRALGRRSLPLLALGVVGASMFIGDSMITPAISVLSAVEGLKLVTPGLEHYVVPLTIVILVLLFSVQSSGTARVASAFGPVMVVWFAVLARDGTVSHQGRPDRAGGDQSAVCDRVRAFPWHHRPGDAGPGVSGGDRRRGAVCRPRSFRPQADPGRLALFRAAGAADQLFRAGRAGAVRSFGDRKFVLPDGSGYPAAAAGGAGDGGDRDREPGGDHRRVFADPAGRATRPAAALRGSLHLGDPCRSDLPAAGQPDAVARRHPAGAVVPHLQRSRFGLWHRRLHHHGRRRHHGLCRDLEIVELARGDAQPP